MARLYSARIQPPLPLVACFYYARQLKLLASTLDFASALLISPNVNQTPLLPVLIRNYELQMHRILILIIQPVLPSRERHDQGMRISTTIRTFRREIRPCDYGHIAWFSGDGV